MKLGDVWFSAIAEAENSDHMIVVSGRTEIEPFIQSGKFKERVEITWKYEADSKGMPNETTGKLMEEVQTVLKQAMEKDKLAIFTGILYRRRRTHMGILYPQYTCIRTYAQRNSRSVRNVTSHHLYRERPRMERISGNVRASRSG